MKKRKIIKLLLSIFLIVSWLLTGWPVIWQNPRIPPEIKKAQAATVTLLPNAAGTISSFTYVSGSLNYTNLQTDDGDTTYAYLPTGNNTNHTVNLDDTSLSGTINSVTAYVVGRAPGTTDDHEIMIYIGATAYNSGTEFGPPSTYTTYSWIMTTSPATGLAWTWAEINSLQVGIETDVYSGAVYYTQMYAVVDYTPPVVSVSVSDGVVSYDIMPANTSKTTLLGELNDIQTANNNGNVTENFNIKGQDASGGGCTWTLAGTNGSDQYVHQFCNATDNSCISPPTNYTVLTTTYQSLKTGVAVSGTVDFHLRLTTPNPSSCFGQQSVNITIQAVQQ